MKHYRVERGLCQGTKDSARVRGGVGTDMKQ